VAEGGDPVGVTRDGDTVTYHVEAGSYFDGATATDPARAAR
jgi:hypothetical protein